MLYTGDRKHPIPPLKGGSKLRLLRDTAKSRGRAIATRQRVIEREGMKIRRLITLIVGITSVALSPMTFAHGGGGGGGGHGAGGGGFHGGGGFRGGGFRDSHFHNRGFHSGVSHSRSSHRSGSRGGR